LYCRCEPCQRSVVSCWLSVVSCGCVRVSRILQFALYILHFAICIIPLRLRSLRSTQGGQATPGRSPTLSCFVIRHSSFVISSAFAEVCPPTIRRECLHDPIWALCGKGVTF
jgi:hypothetical protein